MHLHDPRMLARVCVFRIKLTCVLLSTILCENKKKKHFSHLRWPNTVFACAFADVIVKTKMSLIER